jgi:hypothetical protein
VKKPNATGRAPVAFFVAGENCSGSIKTAAVDLKAAPVFREVLECGSPLPLSPL